MSESPYVRSGPRITATLFVAAALGATLVPVALAAQVGVRTVGPMIGGHLDWSSVGIEDADRSSGAGFGAVVGYGFASGLGVFAQFDRSNIDVRNQPDAPGEWGVWQFDLGVRYHIGGSDRSAVPFVQAAGTLRDVHVTDVGDVGGVPIDEINLRGFAGSVGGGVQLHVSPSFAFELAALLGWGNLTEGTVDGQEVDDFDISVQSFRMDIGVVWWPVG